VRNAYRFLSKKLKEKDHLGDRHKWKDTVKKKETAEIVCVSTGLNRLRIWSNGTVL
jgi:hypothetical protein